MDATALVKIAKAWKTVPGTNGFKWFWQILRAFNLEQHMCAYEYTLDAPRFSDSYNLSEI